MKTLWFVAAAVNISHEYSSSSKPIAFILSFFSLCMCSHGNITCLLFLQLHVGEVSFNVLASYLSVIRLHVICIASHCYFNIIKVLLSQMSPLLGFYS